MNKISLKQHQQIMLDILVVFADFCEKNNLRYFLDAGTLLGAVRHQGFIPWDNDLDVCMPRPDMDRFIELMEKQNFKFNDHIVVEKPEDNLFTFYKIGDTRTKLIEYPDRNPIDCYAYIDVFTKDGLPANLHEAKRICNKSERLNLLNWFYKFSIPCWSKGKNPIKKIIAKTANKLVKNKNKALFMQKKFIGKINKKYPYEQCKYVTTLSNGEYYRMCKKSNFDGYVLSKFENHLFRIPAGYDDWLTVLYGKDYMKIPPKEKQLVHDIELYWR